MAKVQFDFDIFWNADTAGFLSLAWQTRDTVRSLHLGVNRKHWCWGLEGAEGYAAIGFGPVALYVKGTSCETC